MGVDHRSNEREKYLIRRFSNLFGESLGDECRFIIAATSMTIVLTAVTMKLFNVNSSVRHNSMSACSIAPVNKGVQSIVPIARRPFAKTSNAVTQRHMMTIYL